MSDHEDHIMNRANRARAEKNKKELSTEQFRAAEAEHKKTARPELLHDYLVDIVD